LWGLSTQGKLRIGVIQNSPPMSDISQQLGGLGGGEGKKKKTFLKKFSTLGEKNRL
jgi:hypothetical protein